MNDIKPDEDEFIRQLKKGEDKAYRTLIQQYRDKLFNIIYGITLDREESLDILQEVFLKVYRGIGKFEGKSQLFTWLRKIAINECYNWKRKLINKFRWRHLSIDSDETNADLNLRTKKLSPEQEYQKKELENIFNQSLNLLPKDSRAVFVLKEFEGLSYEEIAELLKIKKGTVSSKIFYARKHFKQSLTKFMEKEEG